MKSQDKKLLGNVQNLLSGGTRDFSRDHIFWLMSSGDYIFSDMLRGGRGPD